MKKHIKPGQTYIRPTLIYDIFRGKVLGEKESAIFRILFKRFVKLELKIVISTMKKLKKK